LITSSAIVHCHNDKFHCFEINGADDRLRQKTTGQRCAQEYTPQLNIQAAIQNNHKFYIPAKNLNGSTTGNKLNQFFTPLPYTCTRLPD